MRRAWSCRVAGVAALAVLGCTEHRQPSPYEVPACPDSRLLDTVEGRWEVRFAVYRDGQKPPGQRPLGQLILDGCEFRFELGEEVAAGEYALERAAVVNHMPFVEVPRGRVELIAEYELDSRDPRAQLGALRLTTDPGPGQLGRVFEVGVNLHGRDYMFLRPLGDPRFDGQRFHGSIHRGTYRLLPDEIPVSADPDSPAPPAMQRMYESR